MAFTRRYRFRPWSLEDIPAPLPMSGPGLSRLACSRECLGSSLLRPDSVPRHINPPTHRSRGMVDAPVRQYPKRPLDIRGRRYYHPSSRGLGHCHVCSEYSATFVLSHG